MTVIARKCRNRIRLIGALPFSNLERFRAFAESLYIADVTALYGGILVFKNGHRGEHAKEAKLRVKTFFARHRVKDDFLVPV